MDAKIEQEVDQLILRPDFNNANTFEDLRDLMSLYSCDIIVNVKQVRPNWLEKISQMERKGLIQIKNE